MATQAELDTLNKAIFSGELEVQYQDKKVKYQNTNDMIKARNLLMQDLADGDDDPPVRQVYITSS